MNNSLIKEEEKKIIINNNELNNKIDNNINENVYMTCSDDDLLIMIEKKKESIEFGSFSDDEAQNEFLKKWKDYEKSLKSKEASTATGNHNNTTRATTSLKDNNITKFGDIISEELLFLFPSDNV